MFRPTLLSEVHSLNVESSNVSVSLCVLPGGNRVSQVVSGAHEGGIFSVCVLKDGTMVSGGGKDRKVVLWDHNYRKQTEMEVGGAQLRTVLIKGREERTERGSFTIR